MSRLLFNFSSASGMIDKLGELKVNGFSSYTLAPVGAVSSFEERYQEAYDTTVPPAIDAANAEIQAEVDALYAFIPAEYISKEELGWNGTTVDGSIISQASVDSWTGAFTTKDAAASVYTLATSASYTDDQGVVHQAATGLSLGAMVDGTGTNSFFDIFADNFRIFGAAEVIDENTGQPVHGTGYPKDEFGNPTPVFLIRTNSTTGNPETYFNGRTIFSSMVNDNGETIIDGGLITTEDINVANAITIGSKFAPTNYGFFPQTVDSTMYATPDQSYIDARILLEELPAGTTLQTGDQYQTDTHEYEYVYKLSTDSYYWKSAELVASIDASTKANSALVSSRDNIAYRLGFSNYSDMLTEARANDTIITGGHIRTSLIDADTLIVNNVFTADTNGNPVGDFEIRANGTAGPSGTANIYGATIEAGHISAGSIDSGDLGSALRYSGVPKSGGIVAGGTTITLTCSVVTTYGMSQLMTVSVMGTIGYDGGTWGDNTTSMTVSCSGFSGMSRNTSYSGAPDIFGAFSLTNTGTASTGTKTVTMSITVYGYNESYSGLYIIADVIDIKKQRS